LRPGAAIAASIRGAAIAGPIRAAAIAAVLAGACALGGCHTVDLGTPPPDVNACRPGQQWFIDQIWPMVLAGDYGGKHCYDSQCHGGGSVNLLRLSVPAGPGMIPLPMDWNDDYVAASNEMNCSNVDASNLLLKPTGTTTHGGGMLFAPDAMQAMLIKMWVTMP
jgi:hypothetical protein